MHCFEGIGLHSGDLCAVRLLPASPGTGIMINGRPLTPDCISSTLFATTIETERGPVQTVEHLLAALHGMGIDNVVIDVEGGEIPILDGSALPWLNALEPHDLGKKRSTFVVADVFRVGDESAWAKAEPSHSLELDVRVMFSGHPEKRFVAGLNHFPEVAGARTFGYLSQWETLKAGGYAHGASLDNTLVLNDSGQPMNDGGWRMSDELVRHKWLDLLGDLRILPFHLGARITTYRSGHTLHRALIESIFENWHAEVQGNNGELLSRPSELPSQ